MGLIIANIRLRVLQLSKSDLEYKILSITNSKKNLSQSVSDLTQVGSDLDPESPNAKVLEQRVAKLKVLEQKLDQQMQQYQVELKMIEAEYDSCKEMLTSSIQSSFKYGL